MRSIPPFAAWGRWWQPSRQAGRLSWPSAVAVAPAKKISLLSTPLDLKNMSLSPSFRYHWQILSWTSSPLHDKLVIHWFVEPVWKDCLPGEVSLFHHHQTRLGQKRRRDLAHCASFKDQPDVSGQVEEFSRGQVQVVGAGDGLDGLRPRRVQGAVEYQPQGFATSLPLSHYSGQVTGMVVTKLCYF